eukprot:1190123-Prorocentrum_minimum.AAC.5
MAQSKGWLRATARTHTQAAGGEPVSPAAQRGALCPVDHPYRGPLLLKENSGNPKDAANSRPNSALGCNLYVYVLQGPLASFQANHRSSLISDKRGKNPPPATAADGVELTSS